MVNMLKIKNVVKSSKVAQVNECNKGTFDTGTCVKLVDGTHNQDNSEVSMLNYQKDTKCQKDSIYNPMLYSATDETLVKSTFETIGEEPLFGHCITTQDIMDIYAHGCIQGFYEEYCKLHTDKENLILGKVLSILGIEVFRDITCFGGIYKGKYMVSNLSNVLSLNKRHFGKIVKQYDNGRGYLRVTLWHNNKPQHVAVHRLMALTFIGVPTEKLDACHSNTNSLDNRLFNLEFKTHHENINNPITQRKAKETLKAKADKATATSAE